MTYLVVPRVERVLDDAADELLRQNRELRLESRRERREVVLFVSLEAAGVLDFVDVVSKGRRWARMVLKRCSSERGEREKRFYRGGKCERRRTAF